MANGISRETYEKMPADDKLNVLFDLHKDTQRCACDVETRLIGLEKKVDRKRKIDTTVAAGMGLVGGATVWIIKWISGK